MSALLILTITGCNGKHGGDPINGDYDVWLRNAEIFVSGIPWGTGFKLDSSTTTWIYPVPDGYIAGDVAVEDERLPHHSPLATAFVKHNSSTTPSEIAIVIIDDQGVPRYFNTISAPESITGYQQPLCRYPAVEVTYGRKPPPLQNSVTTEVVWTQLTNQQEPNWDLYYTQIEFRATSSYGVRWDTPIEQPIVPIETANTPLDEFQPDLAAMNATGDLYVIYNRRNPSDWSFDTIYANRHAYSHDWSPVWAAARQVSGVTGGSNTRPKSAPKIDAGLLHIDQIASEYHVSAVWSELYDEYTWQVYYNTWDPLDPGVVIADYADTVTDYTPNRVNALPQIDISPDSSGLHQAVLTWFFCAWSGGSYDNFNVRMAVTPFYHDYSQVSEGNTICPDVAVYQMTDPDEHWFGISYYKALEADPWPVWTRSYSFNVDWGLEYVNIEPKNDVEVPGSDARWMLENPFTGSALSLRYPLIPVEQSLFTISWIDKEGSNAFAACSSQGSIW